MDKAVKKILRKFEKRSEREWERINKMERSWMQERLDEFLLFVGPATGQLINLLAKEAKAQTILEVGSSYGYLTVWLAGAAREAGGKVISLEIHPDKQKHARASIEKAGLAGFVDFRLGDATEKILYIPCFVPVGSGIELSRYK